MKNVRTQLAPAVLRELDALQCQWELRNGSRHLKLFVNGRMCTVITKSVEESKRIEKNIIRSIRHAAAGRSPWGDC
jgi:hypothetical protein